MSDGSGDAATAAQDFGVRPARRVRWWHCVAAGLLYAGLTAVAFPPLSWWPLTFVSVVPLALVALANPARPGLAGLWCAAGALPLWLYEMSWVWRVTAQGFVPVCVYLALYAWLFVWLFTRVLRMTWLPASLAGAVLWSALEVLRGEVVWDGYPWYLVSEPLIDGGVLAMPARVVGPYGLGFLLALCVVSVTALFVLKEKRRVSSAFAILAFAAWGVLAALGVKGGGDNDEHKGAIRVGLVQTNLPSDNKVGWLPEKRLSDLTRFEELTREVAAKHPDFIVWPETMFPGLSLDAPAIQAQRDAGLVMIVNTAEGEKRIQATTFADRLLALQEHAGIPMVVGAIGIDRLRIESDSEGRIRFDHDGRFNSAFVISGGRQTGERYDKIGLTPFGEFMPYISAWPWLEKNLMSLGAHGMSFDLSAGKRTTPLLLPLVGKSPIRIATPICFEVTKPSECRGLVYANGRREADLLVNLTNDGWFQNSDKTRLQHLQLARWRCLELATPMARGANTGICAAIDADGRMVASGIEGMPMAARSEGSLTAELMPPGERVTFFGAHGDVVRWPMLSAGVVLVGISSIARGRSGRGRGAPSRRE